MKSKKIINIILLLIYIFRDEEKVESRLQSKSINNLKDIRKLYKPYCPKILKDSNGFKYNLNEESIFGNLYYSMNQDFLKGKSVDYKTNVFGNNYTNFKNNSKPIKLIPILRYKKA